MSLSKNVLERHEEVLRLITENRALKERITAIARENKLFKQMSFSTCEEWASDHDHIEELCIKCGYTLEEVRDKTGDFLTIKDLANLLAAKIPK